MADDQDIVKAQEVGGTGIGLLKPMYVFEDYLNIPSQLFHLS